MDNLLWALAQRGCDKFQRITGLTKFRIEKWAIILWGVLVCFKSLKAPFDPMFVAFGISAVFIGFCTARTIEYSEKCFLRDGSLLPPVVVSIPLIRMLVIIFSVPHFLVFPVSITSCIDFSYLVWLYTAVCIPRPPGKSKVREKYEQGLQWLHEALQPPPDLAPKPMPCDR